MCSLEPKNEEEKYKKPTVRVGNWNEELFMQDVSKNNDLFPKAFSLSS